MPKTIHLIAIITLAITLSAASCQSAPSQPAADNQPLKPATPTVTPDFIPDSANLNPDVTPAVSPGTGLTEATGSIGLPHPVPQISFREIMKHNKETDCWLIIRSRVYDVTSYLAEHPGGKQAMLLSCGEDATTLFETRPDGSGTPHSTDARMILEDYFIGDLSV